MKTAATFAFSALLALGTVSCSKDTMESGVPGTGVEGGNSITFTLPINSGIITYADPDPVGTVLANAAEKAIDASTIKVYMFDATTNLLQAVLTPSMSTDGKKATITLDNTWADYDANKYFYLTANTGALSVTAKADLTAGGTNKAQFLALTTASQGTTHLKPVEGTASSYLIMTEEVLPLKLATTPTAEVYFRRNVARFDIENNVATGNVTIEEIKVYDAALQGFVFGYELREETAPANMMASPATGELPVVSVTAPVSGVQNQASVMYLYPTIIKADGTGTQIFLKGKVASVSKTFTLKGAADLSIEANKRYKISAIDALTLTFEIAVAEWDEGTNLNGTPDPDAAPFSLVANPTGAGVSAFADNIITVPDAGGAISFVVKASTSQGTSVLKEAVGSNDHSGLISVTETHSSVVTYGEPYFASTYTINVSALTAGEGSTTKLTITDKGNPDNVIVLRIFHAGDNNEIVTIDDQMFPDDVLRDALKEILGSDGGTITSDDLEAVTTLDLSNTSVESLDGIENFSNLEELLLVDCRNISTLHISNDNSKLKKLVIMRAVLSSVDVRNCPVLEHLDIFDCPNVVSVDVTQNPLLKFFCSSYTSISSINVNNNELLEVLGVINAQLSTLDLSKNPELLIVNVHGTTLTSVDLSVQTKLEEVYFKNSKLQSLNLAMHRNLKIIEGMGSTDLTTITLGEKPFLRSITLYNTAISSIDISEAPSLENVQVYGSSNLMTITTNSHPFLKHFSARNTCISSLDIGNMPALDEVNLSATNLTSLDISKNTNLKGFWVSNCPTLSTIKVWEGFQPYESNPIAVFTKGFGAPASFTWTY